MISIKHKGNFNNLEKFLARMTKKDYLNDLDSLGQEGVRALSLYTPKDTGKTSESWNYEIRYSKNNTTIQWINDNFKDGVNIAILLQYGHSNQHGKFIQGIDYINPALKPVFKKIADNAWKVVTNS